MSPRSALASFLLTVALGLAGVAYTALVLRSLVFEPDALAGAADEVLAAAPVRAAFEDRIVEAIERDLFGTNYDDLSAQYGFDARTAAEIVARTTVASPAFREAVHDSLIEFHGHVFDDRDGPIVVDATAVTETARAAAVTHTPELAAILPPTNELRVTVPVDNTPNLGWLEDRVNTVLLWTGLIALSSAAGAFILHSRRQRVLLGIGIGLIVIASGHLLIGFALPALLDQQFTELGDVPIARPLGNALADHLRPAALLVAAMGLVFVVAALVWKSLAPGQHRAPGGRYADY